jgi:hypothetical protein
VVLLQQAAFSDAQWPSCWCSMVRSTTGLNQDLVQAELPHRDGRAPALEAQRAAGVVETNVTICRSAHIAETALRECAQLREVLQQPFFVLHRLKCVHAVCVAGAPRIISVVLKLSRPLACAIRVVCMAASAMRNADCTAAAVAPDISTSSAQHKFAGLGAAKAAPAVLEGPWLPAHPRSAAGSWSALD